MAPVNCYIYHFGIAAFCSVADNHIPARGDAYQIPPLPRQNMEGGAANQFSHK